MVLLHVKKGEEHQFLYETTVEAQVGDTIRELVEIHNLRTRIHRLQLEGEELAKYGVSKPYEKQSIDTYSELVGMEPVVPGEYYNMDPTGRRTGNACSPEAQKVLLKALQDASDLASKSQVARKVCLTKAGLEEALDTVRGAVMIAYPMGLPEWDLVRDIIEGVEELAGTSFAADELEVGGTSMWFAGKELLPENKMRDHVGRHEKSKLIVKLQKRGQGAPAREPVVDAETQKGMMTWYHKKQEEQKRLTENMDDDIANSAWANPKALKTHFSGVSNVRLPK